jgi:hypothetical protein
LNQKRTEKDRQSTTKQARAPTVGLLTLPVTHGKSTISRTSLHQLLFCPPFFLSPLFSRTPSPSVSAKGPRFESSIARRFQIFWWRASRSTRVAVESEVEDEVFFEHLRRREQIRDEGIAGVRTRCIEAHEAGQPWVKTGHRVGDGGGGGSRSGADRGSCDERRTGRGEAGVRRDSGRACKSRGTTGAR